MNKIIQLIFLSALIIFSSGCDVRVYTGERSGSDDKDYVEEPIRKNSIKYTNALNVSNEIMDKLKDRDYKYIYDNYVHNDMKSTLTVDALKSIYEQVFNAVGPITNYKKMQWGFRLAEEEGKDLVFSFKIAEHKNELLNYIFVFYDDEKYNKISGVMVKQFDGARKPNDF